MTPVFTTKLGRQHRYYVTRLNPGEDRKSVWRVPAGDIDRAVLACTSKFLTQRAAEDLDADDCAFPLDLARHSVPEQRRVLLEALVRVQLKSSELIISIGDETDDHIQIPANLARRGNELKLVLCPNDAAPEDTDPVLLKLVTHAIVAQQAALSGDPDPIVSNYSKRHLWQLLRVSWLAPDIIVAITEGRQPPTLTGRRLLRAADVPLSWEEQRLHFGFN